MRRYIITAICLIGLFVLILFNPLDLYRLPFGSISSFEAVPSKSSLVLEIAQPKSMFNGFNLKNVPDQIADFSLLKKLTADFELLGSVFDIDGYSFYESNCVAALQGQHSAKNQEFLYILDSERKFNLNEFLDYANVDVRKNTYRNFDIYEIELEDGRKFAFAPYRNLLILGKYSLMIEESVNQLKNYKENISRDEDFQQLIEDESKYHARLFVNMPSLHYAMNSWVKKSHVPFMKNIGAYGNWIGTSFLFEPESINAEFIFPTTQGNQFFEALSNSPIDRNRMAKVLPENLSMLSWFGIGDAKRFYNKVAESKDNLFEEYCLPWMGEEMAIAITEPYSQELKAQQFLLIQTPDTALARHYLEKFADEAGTLNLINYRGTEIRQVKSEHLFASIFGEKNNPVQNPYYAFVENYVVLCNSRSGIEIWIDHYDQKQTLEENESYQAFNTDQPRKSNFYCYLNVERLVPIVKFFAANSSRNKTLEDFAKLETIGQIGIDLNYDDKLVGKPHFYYRDRAENETSIVWKNNLEADAYTRPFVLKSGGTGKYEIFVQDKKKNIYLLRDNGKLILKKKVLDFIISDIHVVDYYGNGNQQLLFNSENYIYLIDRKGEHMPSFPIKLQSPATNGMAMIDFEALNDYSIFIACENRNVYGFDKSGSPLSGWSPKSGLGLIEYPLKHFQNNGRDFILAMNTSGKLYAFKRNGEKRFDVPTQAKFLIPPVFQNSTDHSRIVAVDDEGMAHNVNLEGKSFKMKLNVGTNESVKGIYADVAGDDRYDYISISGNYLSANYYNAEDKFSPLFTLKFKTSQDAVFPIQMNGLDKAMIGTLSTRKKQISLVTAKGKLYPDFPLSGTSEFEVLDLFGDDRNILIVANGSSVYAYRLL